MAEWNEWADLNAQARDRDRGDRQERLTAAAATHVPRVERALEEGADDWDLAEHRGSFRGKWGPR